MVFGTLPQLFVAWILSWPTNTKRWVCQFPLFERAPNMKIIEVRGSQRQAQGVNGVSVGYFRTRHRPPNAIVIIASRS